MQCPPRPGPGVNFMKPYGLVAAASMTSHTSRSSFSHMSATSFTRPMLIMRKVFSSSFTISAAWVEDTGTIVSKTVAKTWQASCVQRGVSPPTTFGTFFTLNFVFAGSMRSGAKASAKSLPIVSPASSSSGITNSWVVPG